MARVAELWKDLGRRGRIALVGAAAAVGVALPLLSFGPIVRSRVERKALARGLVAQVERVRPSFGGVWLLGVRVTSRDVRRIEGSVDAVLVPFGGGAIEVHGGRVALRGTPEQIRASLRASNERAQPSGAKQPLVADGLFVRWSELDAQGTQAEAWGVGLKRGESEQVSAELVRVRRSGAEVHARRAEVLLSSGARPALKSARIGTLDLVLDLTQAGTPEADGPPAPGTPATDAARAGSVTRAATALALVQLLKSSVPEGATVAIGAARFDLRFAHERVGIGPSAFSLRRTKEELGVALEPADRPGAGATPLALRGHLPLPEGNPSLEIEGGPVSLGVLGVKDGELGLTRTRDATVEAHLRLELLAGGVVRATGSGALVNLSILRQELGPRELRGLRLAFRGSGDFALDGSSVKIGDSELALGDVKLAGNLELERDERALRVRGSGGVPLAACDALLGSLPTALVGDLAGVRLSGTFGLSSSVGYDSARPDDLTVKLKVSNDCRVVDAPEGFSPARFRRAWTREVKAPDGSSVLTQSGPGTADYKPYAQISRYMETAVLVCEDGGFHRHRGFDFRAIEKALKDDLRAGRFLRGASTISMQLAKNLYLGREKTLARKVQEALLTMLLEERLSKQEILELYLNIVELGPGIYGVGQAAEHYFAKPASELTLAQALYLASILPDPTRQHFNPDGSVSPRWDAYLKKLMNIARQVKLITDEELEAGLREEIAFRKPGEGGALPAAGGGEALEFAPPEADFDVGP